MTNSEKILVLNVGSSSVKYALYNSSENSEKITEGKVADITQVNLIISEIQNFTNLENIIAVGHRIVTGGAKYSKSTIIDSELINFLEEQKDFYPNHLPNEILLIKNFLEILPNAKAVACFDNMFYTDLPRLAQILPIPRKYEQNGLRRYGFHGLSYSFVFNKLQEKYGEKILNSKIIIAHLGSGASVTAIKNGKVFDTTMGFSPDSGIPMSTRSGDLDPGLALYFSVKENMGAKEFHNMVSNESGLLGISEITNDMEKILEQEDSDVRCKEAADFFCYQVKKTIGGFSAIMGGLDILIFTGGMAENAPKIRARVCSGLEFLGINFDEKNNLENQDLISKPESKVLVERIRSDEESIMIKEIKKVI